MARLFEPTVEQVALWERWVAGQGELVQELAARLDPWSLYQLGPFGPRVTVVGFASIDDSVSVIVSLSSDHNFTAQDRRIAGIDPDHLLACDLPDLGFADGPARPALCLAGDCAPASVRL